MTVSLLGLIRLDSACLRYASLCFAGRYPQSSRQHISPRGRPEHRGVALTDQLPNQPPVEGRHLLVDLTQPLEEFRLLGACQCFQRKRRKFSVACFSGIESRDDVVLIRTYVLLICLIGPMLVRWPLQMGSRWAGWTIRGPIKIRAWFPDDASCAEYLARLRWPEGFRCPVCGGDKAWQTSTQHWKCAGCGRKTSVTAGTIFHRTRTPLSTWFAAIWLVTSQKNGASAQNLHDMLGLGSYETAWAWLHKLRRAMVRPDRELLAGAVEVDEAFIGGRATGRQGASTEKVPVMIAVENLGTQVDRKLRLGRVRLAVADAPGSKRLATSPGPLPHRAH